MTSEVSPASNQLVAQQIVAALKEAAKTEQPSEAGLAAKAYNALQFDFPLVESAALEALCKAYADEPAAALRRFPLTASLLAGVLEGAERKRPTPEAASLCLSYQRLCGALFGRCFNVLLSLPDDDDASLLARFPLPDPEAEDDHAPASEGEGTRDEAALAAAVSRVSLEEEPCQGSESDWEDLPLPAAAPPHHTQSFGPSEAGIPTSELAERKLAHLSSLLSPSAVDAPGAWEQCGLSAAVVESLQACCAERHACEALRLALRARALRLLPPFPDALAPAVSSLLARCGSDEEGADAARLAAAVTSLARPLPSQPSPAWFPLQATLPLLRPRLERLVRPPPRPRAAAAGAPPPPPLPPPPHWHQPELHHLMCVASFLLLHPAPAGHGADGADSLLSAGWVRSMAALVADASAAQPAQPAQLHAAHDHHSHAAAAVARALLLACATSGGVLAYARAVPGVSAAMAIAGDGVAPVWDAITTGDEGAAARALAGLGGGGGGGGTGAGAAAVACAVRDAALARAAGSAGPAAPMWAPGGAVRSALRVLHSELRGAGAAGAPSDAAEVVVEKEGGRRAALRDVVKQALAAIEGRTAKD